MGLVYEVGRRKLESPYGPSPGSKGVEDTLLAARQHICLNVDVVDNNKYTAQFMKLTSTPCEGVPPVGSIERKRDRGRSLGLERS